MYEEFRFTEQCTILPEPKEAFCADIDSKFSDAMEHPFDFPRLSEAIVPNDRIAIAVSRQVPQLDQIVKRLIEHLVQNQIAVEDIAVVFSEASAEGKLSSGLEGDEVLGAIRVSHQDLEDPNAMAYLGADQAGEPIYVNRELFDADMVIPVLRHDLANDQRAEGIVPDFCCRARFEPENPTAPPVGRSSPFDADAVNDQLGVFFSLEVVVGPGNQVAKIIAGNREAVRTQREQLLDEVWGVEPVAEPDLIVATVEGDRNEQNWHAVTRAVEAANQLSATSPIVLLTELREKPHRELKKAIQGEILGERKPAQQTAEYQRMAEVVGRRPVHLRSQLAEDIVEDLGIGFVQEAADVQRLIDSAKRCVVLRDAHRCRLKSAK